MINWKHLPVESLDGVSAKELQFLSNVSFLDHSQDEDLKDFIEFITDPSRSDDNVLDVHLPEEDIVATSDASSVASDGVSSELDDAELQSLPKTTRDQMKQHGSKFVNYMASLGLSQHTLATIGAEQLNEYLRLYYFRLKKPDGELYSAASLVCIRAGIQRYFRHVIKREVNLVGGSEFSTSNRMLRVKVRQFHSAGGSVKHYEPIELGDLSKLQEYFNRTTGERLQDEVIFMLLYVLGERGQEHLKSLRRRDLLLDKVDSDGHPYLELPTLPTKNQSADPNKAKSFVAKQARIYGMQRELILLYSASLPIETKDDTFFPRPVPNKDGIVRFSTKQVRGINWLGSIMQRLSKVCLLSRTYTNHCIRVTRIADLKDSGFVLSDIMCITGQQNEATVRRYLSRKRDNVVREASSSIGQALVKRASSAGPASTSASAIQPSYGESIEPAVATPAASNISNRSIGVTGCVGSIFAECRFENCTFTFSK